MLQSCSIDKNSSSEIPNHSINHPDLNILFSFQKHTTSSRPRHSQETVERWSGRWQGKKSWTTQILPFCMPTPFHTVITKHSTKIKISDVCQCVRLSLPLSLCSRHATTHVSASIPAVPEIFSPTVIPERPTRCPCPLVSSQDLKQACLFFSSIWFPSTTCADWRV